MKWETIRKSRKAKEKWIEEEYEEVGRTRLYFNNIKQLASIILLDSESKVMLHIEKANCKRKTLFSLRKLSPCNIKVMLCHMFVLSQFNHCLPVHYPRLDKYEKHRMQKIWNSCMRFMFDIFRNLIMPLINYMMLSGLICVT